MTWFDKLTGFPESSAEFVRANLSLSGDTLQSLANGRSIAAGTFSTPSLAELRQNSELRNRAQSKLSVSELVGDVQSLHHDPSNENAVIQVASQFNCLEMASPRVIPERGVGIYENDRTQGPVCCICAGGGTIFRNYFVDVNGCIGQTSDNQIDCLDEIGSHFNNHETDYWRMQNGYCFPSTDGLIAIEHHLSDCNPDELDLIRQKLKVGVQSGTEVTSGNCNHRLTQVFCSAVPVAYSDVEAHLWNLFPKLILDATYESAFHLAVKNFETTGCSKLYLTLVGGGVFGNHIDWISSAIERSLNMFADYPLDVYIVSYRNSNPSVAKIITRQNAE